MIVFNTPIVRRKLVPKIIVAICANIRVHYVKDSWQTIFSLVSWNKFTQQRLKLHQSLLFYSEVLFYIEPLFGCVEQNLIVQRNLEILFLEKTLSRRAVPKDENTAIPVHNRLLCF